MKQRKLTYGAPTEKCATLVRLGIHEGIFAVQGLDMNVEVIFSGPQLARAYGAGQIQIGEMGSPPSTTAISRGADFRIVGGGARRKLLTWLVTRRDVHSLDQLKGRRFGTLSPGSCGDWFFRQMLRSHGLSDQRDVEIVGIGDDYPRQVELVESGELDATLLVEPAVSVAEANGKIRVHQGVYEEPEFTRFQWCILAANNGFAGREPETVASLLEGYRASIRFAVANPDIWAQFLRRHFGLPAAVAERAVARERALMVDDATVDLPGLESALALQRRLGAITSAITVGDVVNPSFVPLPDRASSL